MFTQYQPQPESFYSVDCHEWIRAGIDIVGKVTSN